MSANNTSKPDDKFISVLSLNEHYAKKDTQTATEPVKKDETARIFKEKKEDHETAEQSSSYIHGQDGVTVEKQVKKIEKRICNEQGERVNRERNYTADSKTGNNQAKDSRNPDTEVRTSFLASRQTTQVHMLHPHPHRRHYPHHLLDHFSSNLTHHASPQVSWEQFIPATAAGKGTGTGNVSSKLEWNKTTVSMNNHSYEKESSDTDKIKVATEDSTTTAISEDSNCNQSSSLQTPHAWPFFGTEARVLPSGRRTSFLRQACLGFTRTKTKEENKDISMETICPRALKQGNSASFMRKNYFHTSSGTNVAELKKKFNQLAQTDSEQREESVKMKFKNETVKGPQIDAKTSQQNRGALRIETPPVIIGSSSTKGNHPIPKAPGLRSPGIRTESKSVDTAGIKMKSKIISPAANRIDQSLHKSRKDSSITKKNFTNALCTDDREAKPVENIKRGSKIVKSQNKVDSGVNRDQETAPAKLINTLFETDKKANNNKGAGNQVSRRTAIKPAILMQDNKNSVSVTASDFPCEATISSEDDISSTYEEHSIDAKDLSDRRFLIDYGDPSRFYFRNEWGSRMLEIEEGTRRMKKFLMECDLDQEVQKGVVGIIENVEELKEEMGELYDYFDHFEREEDTLLQQVQRQLMQANRYCNILQYRLDKAEKHQTEDRQVKELQEELKLSRQVAVSLHWELQASDAKQAKIENENIRLRQSLLSEETSNEALRAKVSQLENSIDQISLHAPSLAINTNKEGNGTSSDSTTELKRQVLFFEEKEDIMVARLADLQLEKDTLKDELQKYREQYGELSSVFQSGANRHTDLKLRLKLAEDQAGLLARKLMELQLQNDNMIKMAAEKELLEKEVIRRNPSVSDLQFLEDERESLRLALDEMEIENQKLAAELLRYKQAVHRQLHSNSSSTESSLDVGLMVRIPRSADSLLEEENKLSVRSHKTEEKNVSHHETADGAHGDRNKIRPLSLKSPLNQTQQRLKISLSRTLSDLAIPLSPDSNSGEAQVTPVTATISTPGSKSSLPSVGSRKLSSQKSKQRKPVMVDVSAGEDVAYEPKTSPRMCNKSVQECRNDLSAIMRSEATSPVTASNRPAIDVAVQMCERKFMRSQATSPVSVDKGNFNSEASHTSLPAYSKNVPSHSVLMDEMRKQIACVRNIAESMDNVVDVKEMEAELERKGREIVNTQYERLREKSIRKRQFSKIAKTFKKYIQETELSASISDPNPEVPSTIRGDASEVNGWNLHGNAEVTLNPDENSDISTITQMSSSSETPSRRTILTNYHLEASSDITSQVSESVVLIIITYVLTTSLPMTALFQICFLLLVFFIC